MALDDPWEAEPDDDELAVRPYRRQLARLDEFRLAITREVDGRPDYNQVAIRTERFIRDWDVREFGAFEYAVAVFAYANGEDLSGGRRGAIRALLRICLGEKKARRAAEIAVAVGEGLKAARGEFPELLREAGGVATVARNSKPLKAAVTKAKKKRRTAKKAKRKAATKAA